MEALQLLKQHLTGVKFSTALVIILANALTEPLADDLRSVFGTAIWYHPVTVWVALICIVSVNTGSLVAGILLVLVYEALKAMWRFLNMEAPHVARMRRLVSKMNSKGELDDEDIQFIDKVTPSSVKVQRVDQEATGLH